MKVVYAVPHPVDGALRQRVTGVVRALMAVMPDVTVTVLAPSLNEAAEGSPPVHFVQVEAVVPSGSAATKVLRRTQLGRDTVQALEHMDPDLVVVYGGGALYMGRIQAWARARGKAVAADAVEWYDASHLPGGKWGPFALDNEVMMRRTLLRSDGVIAISSLLGAHVSRGSSAPVIVVPPILDVDHMAWASATGPRQRLVYCGNPGLKDNLGVVIAAMAEVDPEGHDFELLIAGPDATRVARLPGVRTIPASVRALGRVSAAESLRLMASATWAPLVRPDRRYAHAGFPTKIVEALASGTPPIANLTSDLGRYLVHGSNALVLQDASLASFVDALVVARSLTGDQRESMSVEARRTAAEHFDFKCHSAHLGAWVTAVAAKGEA